MMLTVKLTQSSSIDPQDTALESVVNPPCWASETAVSLNLTIPSGPIDKAPRWVVYGLIFVRVRCHVTLTPSATGSGSDGR